jgi:alanyl-tRNA synthetase
MGCAPEEVAAAAERVLSEREANFKSYRAALERLAKAEATLALQSAPPGPNGLRVIARVLEDSPGEYLGFFAARIAESEKTIALLFAKYGGHLLFAQHPSAGKDMNALLKQVLGRVGGKGGGTRDFARGRLDDPMQAESALYSAKELLSTS